MSIVLRSFPECCTAQVLAGFDETHVASIGHDDPPNKERLKEQVLKQEQYLFDCGYAVVVATLNSEQTTGAEVLEELGWKSSGFGNSKKHWTKVSLWFKLLNPVQEDN